MAVTGVLSVSQGVAVVVLHQLTTSKDFHAFVVQMTFSQTSSTTTTTAEINILNKAIFWLRTHICC